MQYPHPELYYHLRRNGITSDVGYSIKSSYKIREFRPKV